VSDDEVPYVIYKVSVRFASDRSLSGYIAISVARRAYASFHSSETAFVKLWASPERAVAAYSNDGEPEPDYLVGKHQVETLEYEEYDPEKHSQSARLRAAFE